LDSERVDDSRVLNQIAFHDVLISQCQQRPLAIRKDPGDQSVYGEAAEGLVVTESQGVEGERLARAQSSTTNQGK
jgi:hypothetical protein